MMKTVEVYSDGVCYWCRWMAVLFGLAIIYWLGVYVQDEGPAVTFNFMIGALTLCALLLAVIHRPKSFRIVVNEPELVVEKLPGNRCRGVFPLSDVRYIAVRSTGHLFNLSVLVIAVRTSQGSHFFGPIYKNGVDSITSSQVAQLLPRLERPSISSTSS